MGAELEPFGTDVVREKADKLRVLVAAAEGIALKMEGRDEHGNQVSPRFEEELWVSASPMALDEKIRELTGWVSKLELAYLDPHHGLKRKPEYANAVREKSKNTRTKGGKYRKSAEKKTTKKSAKSLESQ